MFLAVARAGQILEAARRLGVNQATLSRRVAALEEAIGAKLLVRRPHGSTLTEAGEKLAATLERMEGELANAHAELSAEEQAVAGTVRIGAPDGFGVAFLAPRLARFAERYPALRVQLAPTPRSFSLSRREADIAVMVGRPEVGKLVARRLTDYTLSLYASRSYLAAYGAPSSAADLSAHRLVGYVEDLIHAPGLSYTREFLRNWRSQIEIAGAIGQVEAVRAGAGVGVLHDYLARDAPDLVSVLPSLRVRRAYWLAMHDDLRSVGRVRVASDFLGEIVDEARSQFVVEPSTR
ncbi:MAG: LysR family transcriptional regulator [Neomegalonema sp.]|nr:LysR family transcriptional regulator [Neomegalonema sp.]